jgi:hypothetical protein
MILGGERPTSPLLFQLSPSTPSRKLYTPFIGTYMWVASS